MPRSKKWITTIDQRTPNNGGQRYGPYVSEMMFMTAAVEGAVREAGLLEVIHGNYQITVTKYTPEALERIQRISKSCGAQDYAYDDDDKLIIYGTCQLPHGHTGRHQETREGKVWANWSGPSDARAPQEDQ